MKSTENKNVTYTYYELAQHDTYNDAWISINGQIYDITSFIKRHAGGDVFLGYLGTDCSNIFSQSHMMHSYVENDIIVSDYYLKLYNIKKIGNLNTENYRYSVKTSNGEIKPELLTTNDRILYIKTNKDKIWNDLKEDVVAFIKTNNLQTKYSTFEAIILILQYFAVYLLLCYYSLIYGSYFGTFLSALFVPASCGFLAHTSAHNGFSSNSVINWLAKQFFDISGGSWLQWQREHVSHHEAPFAMFDYQTNYTEPFLRIHEFQEYCNHYQYQHFYYIIVIMFYAPIKLIRTTYYVIKWSKTSKNPYFNVFTHLLFTMLFFFQYWYAAHFIHHSYVFVLKLLIVYLISTSYSTYIFLYASAQETKIIFTNKNINNYQHYTKSWAKIQIQTANNWFTYSRLSAFITFLLPFRYHIEHHLFPTFRPDLYPQISGIVQNICKKHSISYTLLSFAEVLKSDLNNYKQKGSIRC